MKVFQNFSEHFFSKMRVSKAFCAHYLMLIFALSISFEALAQANQYWFMENRSIDFTTNEPISRQSAIGFGMLPQPPQNVTNGVATPDGRLLFQVLDKTFFHARGIIPYHNELEPNNQPNNAVRPSQEVSIFKKNNCNQYGVLYGRYHIATGGLDIPPRNRPNPVLNTTTSALAAPEGYSLYYTEYDVINPSVSLDDNVGKFSTPIRLLTLGGDVGGVGMAVSKPFSDGTRYAYIALGYKPELSPIVKSYLVRVKLLASGPAQPEILWSSQDTDPTIFFSMAEMDLSPDGRKLVFGRFKPQHPQDIFYSNKDLVIFHLDGSGNLAQPNPTTIDLPSVGDNQSIIGVEFASDNATVYYSVPGMGIAKIDINTLREQSIDNTIEFSNSQLESNYSFDERIYAANKNNNRLGYIETATGRVFNNAVSNAGVTVFSRIGGFYYIPSQFAVLPDQIDGEDYRTWTSGYTGNTTCCAAVHYNDNEELSRPIEISQNVIWTPRNSVFPFTSATSVITEGVIVKRGYRLEINNMTLKFGTQAKIVVESGATLVVNNSTLTATDCNSTWGGIESSGGNVTINNNSTINYALVGVHAIGGGLLVRQATFTNNQKDIRIFGDAAALGSRPPLSTRFFIYKIEQSTFNVDNQWRWVDSRTRWNPRIELVNNSLATISNCTFAVNAPNFGTRGIYSLDGRYSVGGSKFTGFNIAIDAQGAGGNKSFTAIYNEFNSNATAIQATAVNNYIVENNVFKLDGFSNPNSHGIGIWGKVGTGYSIKSNTFTGAGANAPKRTYGIWLDGSGEADNLVYQNTFTNCYIANVAWNKNYSADFSRLTGLRYNCNDMSNNLVDIYVAGDGSDTGIKVVQGDISDPDGNQFSTTGYWKNYFNRGTFDIWYIQANNNRRPPRITPREDRITVWNFGSNAPCLPKSTQLQLADSSQNTLATLNETYNSLEQSYNNLRFSYISYINRGDKEALLNNIKYDWADDAWEMRNKLLEQSPKLSGDVLLEAAKTGVMPQAMLMEILIANVNVCKDESLLKELQYNIPNPLPDYLIEFLRQAPSAFNLKQNMEIQLSAIQSRLSETNDILIKIAQENDQIVTLREELQKAKSPMHTYALAETYVNLGATQQVNSILQQMEQDFTWVQKNTDAHEAYKYLSSIKTQMFAANQHYKELSANELAQIEFVATAGEGLAQQQAKNILCYVKGNYCDEFGAPSLNPTTNGSARIAQLPKKLDDFFTKSSVYPNPAKDFATIEYTLPEYYPESTLLITDIAGQIIHTAILKQHKGQFLWDTRNVKAGMYFYKIQHKDDTKAVGKIAVAK